MKLNGSGGQRTRTHFYDASGTITSGGTAQLIVPEARERTSWVFVNNSDTVMTLEFGAARATASLSSGTVSSLSVTNAGFGYSIAPNIEFYGGAYGTPTQITPTSVLQGLPDFISPSNSAKARCVMSGSAPNMTVGSIVVDNPGSNYAYPPFVLLTNNHADPFGAAVPSATVGLLMVASGGSYTNNGTICVTDQISVFCSASSKSFTFKFTTN